MISHRIIASPLGDILLRAEGERLSGAYFAGQKYHPVGVVLTPRPPAESARVFEQAADELADYFRTGLPCFTVALRLDGSAFQREVWQALLAIVPGQTLSYGELAGRLGLAASHARAVGGAVGRNPISVIVPCHRVLGASGSLTGYAGGVERKRFLLRLEASAAAGQLPVLRAAALAAA